MIAKEGDNLTHHHNSDELALCKKLSEEVAGLMTGQVMVDDEADHEFLPFFVAANEGSPVPETITEAVIQSAFHGTLYPGIEIRIEALTEDARWWHTIRECAYGLYEEEANYLSCWRSVMDWFHKQPELHGSAFINIGREAIRNRDDGCGTGCVFPRLVVGLSRRGSLIGIFTCVTHT